MELNETEKVLKVEGLDFNFSKNEGGGLIGPPGCYGNGYLAHTVVVTTNERTFKSSGQYPASITVWTVENSDGLCEFGIHGADTGTTTLADSSAGEM